MTVTRRPASRYTAVSGTWTYPENTYFLPPPDNLNNQCLSAKNTTYSEDIGFPDVTTSDATYPLYVQANDIAYGNGEFAICVYQNGRPGIVWSPEATGPWLHVELTAAGDTPYAIAYGNGYWVAVGSAGNLWYATSLGGTWTSNDIVTGSSLQAVHYDNGYWVVGSAAGQLYYRATDPTGTWTTGATTGTSPINAIKYANGYWVALCNTGGATYYSADPTAGSWTLNTISTASWFHAHYANGYWVFVGSSGKTYYRATDPTGAFTGIANGSESLLGVTYANGYWVTVGTGGAVYYKNSTTPSSPWTSNTQGTATLQGLATDGTALVAPCYSYTVAGRSTTDPTGTWDSLSNVEPGIPDGSTINSVLVRVLGSMSASVTGGVLGAYPRINNANSGSEGTKSTSPTTETEFVGTFGTVALSDLRGATTSDLVETRLRVTKGSTNSAMTGYFNQVYLEIDFSPPALEVPPPSLVMARTRT